MNITIDDDDDNEDTEDFCINLTTSDSDVILMPPSACVSIEDNDG